MRSLVKIWLDICLLRARPQDLPASTFLLSITVPAYVTVNMILALSHVGIFNAISLAVLDVAVLALFVHLALQTRGYEMRFTQVLTALVGTGTFLGMLAIPLLILQTSQTPGSNGGLVTFLWLVWIVWNLLVLGHILRHALSTSMAVGLFVGFGYMVFSIYLMQLLFPGVS